MKTLFSLISRLESKIIHYDATNLSISGESVGWHIEHSLKTIDQIIIATKKSNPGSYKWKFNFYRLLILDILNKIPRGKAKAPKIVRPEGTINPEVLQLSLQKVKKNLDVWNDLNKNNYFPHPYFGDLNKKPTEKFLVLHTNHHLKIIDDILN
ncbi:MAG TPA: DUF1569 domain-containing protein [Flavobacterium sp.]|uniref:DUF1569 domain-containing protein n=1 Tax=Flavobacterium sp. TaxID=239 RepID=UPI002B4AB20C|nr:DUF1569 domain-containing protein [Flavobacterium sp.]HLO72821.1 DUF1569 domain-containing protein [Flavobacterium sp.]